MGLSTINVEFKAAAQTAVKRSANGTVALILKDETKGRYHIRLQQ